MATLVPIVLTDCATTASQSGTFSRGIRGVGTAETGPETPVVQPAKQTRSAKPNAPRDKASGRKTAGAAPAGAGTIVVVLPVLITALTQLDQVHDLIQKLRWLGIITGSE